MSGKNHKMIDGRLLQMDKKYSQLKLKQKEKIAAWMYEETKSYYQQHDKMPEGKACSGVVERVYGRIESAEIWISFDQVYRHYMKKKNDTAKRIRRDMGQAVNKQSETVCLMNMCMIRDNKGNVLVLDKVDDSYTGITFPGGHVEHGETFAGAVIREVWEETGLRIYKPMLCGIYHWQKIGVRNVVFLYRTDNFEGELNSSEEGEVYWLSEDDFLTENLAPGMDQVWKIMQDPDIGECHMYLEGTQYTEKLL